MLFAGVQIDPAQLQFSVVGRGGEPSLMIPEEPAVTQPAMSPPVECQKYKPSARATVPVNVAVGLAYTTSIPSPG